MKLYKYNKTEKRLLDIREVVFYWHWIPATRITVIYIYIYIYRVIEKYRTPLISSVRMHFGENVQ